MFGCGLFFMLSEKREHIWMLMYRTIWQCIANCLSQFLKEPPLNKCLIECQSYKTNGIVPKMNKTVFLCFHSPKKRPHFKLDPWSDAHSLRPRIKLTTVGRFSCCRLVDLEPTAKIHRHDPRAAIRRRIGIFYYFESLFEIFWVSVLNILSFCLKGSFKTGRPRPTAKILRHDARAAIRRSFDIFYYFESLYFVPIILKIVDFAPTAKILRHDPRFSLNISPISCTHVW